jgi:hypothetical protein
MMTVEGSENVRRFSCNAAMSMAGMPDRSDGSVISRAWFSMDARGRGATSFILRRSQRFLPNLNRDDIYL